MTTTALPAYPRFAGQLLAAVNKFVATHLPVDFDHRGKGRCGESRGDYYQRRIDENKAGLALLQRPSLTSQERAETRSGREAILAENAHFAEIVNLETLVEEVFAHIAARLLGVLPRHSAQRQALVNEVLVHAGIILGMYGVSELDADEIQELTTSLNHLVQAD